jgi:hypothetical protein
MTYAVWIGPAANSAVAAAREPRQPACGGPRSSVAADLTGTTRSRGSATLQPAGNRPVQPSQTKSHPVKPSQTLNFAGQWGGMRAASGQIAQKGGFWPSKMAEGESASGGGSVRLRRAYGGQVAPSQTQSNLVKPSPTLNFPGGGGGWSNLANFGGFSGGWGGQKKGLPSLASSPYSSPAFSSDVPQQASRRQEIKSHSWRIRWKSFSLR